MRTRLSLSLAFVLGACAGTTASVVATPLAGSTSPLSSEGAPDTPSVVAEGAAASRVAGSGKARITELVRGQNAFLGRLWLAAGAAVPEHRDGTEEYLHVLSGGGVLTIDDQEYMLSPGSTVFMPAKAKVSYKNGSEELVALQVFAGPEPAAKYDDWAVSPEPQR